MSQGIVQAKSLLKANNSRYLLAITKNRYELQNATSGLMECLRELVNLKLVRWLPLSAVACTALPLVLKVLDAKLSAVAEKPTSAPRNHWLSILFEALSIYQMQYDSVGWVTQIIRHIINLAELYTMQLQDADTYITEWTDLLASQPSLYLRLALTLDISLSKWRLATEGDLPVSFRRLFGRAARPLRILAEEDGGKDQFRDEAVSKSSSKSQGSIPGDGTDSALGEQTQSHIEHGIHLATRIFSLHEHMSPAATSGFEGTNREGSVIDISAGFIHAGRCEMDNKETKGHRDTVMGLLEMLEGGEMIGKL
ncbi:Fc.00g093360.m01.CDS01 [Cosmosporella sp. VM-42]